MRLQLLSKEADRKFRFNEKSQQMGSLLCRLPVRKQAPAIPSIPLAQLSLFARFTWETVNLQKLHWNQMENQLKIQQNTSLDLGVLQNRQEMLQFS